VNVAPFVNGAYAVTCLFLLAACGLTLARYRRARRRLAAVDPRA
jgi:heme exporter protein CcmD